MSEPDDTNPISGLFGPTDGHKSDVLGALFELFSDSEKRTPEAQPEEKPPHCCEAFDPNHVFWAMHDMKTSS